jgi:signal transduction histidine kinase
MAKLVIRDQGVGIAPEDQGRLFERFERVRLDRDVTGYGVGLWIVRRVLDAHGGSVTVESKLGEGSSFTVQLPSHNPDTQPGRPREKDPEVRPPAFH